MSVLIREFKKSDVEGITKIYDKQPDIGVPSLRNMVVNTTIENDKGEIIAYGIVKIFAEMVLILDKEVPKQDKAQALMEAMKTAILFSKNAGIEMLYAISSSESFTKVLENRWKMKRVPGTLLCLDLVDIEDRQNGQ